MNSRHRAIRELLRGMAPARAIDCIDAFDLPEDERTCLIQCDVRRKSYPQVYAATGMTPEVIKRCRRRAFAHIADLLDNV